MPASLLTSYPKFLDVEWSRETTEATSRRGLYVFLTSLPLTSHYELSRSARKRYLYTAKSRLASPYSVYCSYKSGHTSA